MLLACWGSCILFPTKSLDEPNLCVHLFYILQGIFYCICCIRICTQTLLETDVGRLHAIFCASRYTSSHTSHVLFCSFRCILLCIVFSLANSIIFFAFGGVSCTSIGYKTEITKILILHFAWLRNRNCENVIIFNLFIYFLILPKYSKTLINKLKTVN